MASENRGRRSRRAYLAGLAATIGFGGCLGLEDSTATPSTARSVTDTPTPGPDTDTASSTPDDAQPESPEEPDESLPPGTRWTFGASGPFVAGPVYHDGTVIATSVDRHVYAVDAATGDQQWAVETETKLDKGLTLIDGTAVAAGVEEQLGVAVGDGTTTYHHVGFDRGVRQQTPGDGVVYQCRFNTGGVRAVDPATGDVVWSDITTERPAADESHGSAVAMASDGETLCVGVQPENQFGSPPWGFAGYDAETREQLWYVERDLDFDNVSPEVAVSEGVCFGAIDGHYMAIDARSGTVRTEVEQSNMWGVYGAVDGTVLVIRDGELHGADIATGETRWRSDVTGQSVFGPTSLDGSTFRFVADGKLYEVDVPSGSVRERQSLDVGNTSVTGGIAVTDETVFVTTEDATLRALERQ